MTTTIRRCPRCNGALSATAAAQCPTCLLDLALAPSPSAAAAGAPAPSIDELQPLFPEHELQVLLGRGGMGAVYRARHKKLDRVVALKVLLPELVADPTFAERFEREARALARLDHPGIVGVHDFGRAGAYWFLVMQFVDGASLRDLLAQGRLTARDVLAFAPQLCDALQYAHDHGVVHRDIKPENILVDQDGRVRIADFGLAKLIGRERSAIGLTQTRQALGTPHYMAPEQVHAAGAVDHRADLYSLGVVLYEMLTGELPIGRFQPPSAKAATPRSFDPVVMRSLENDPAQRYQAAADVKRDVEAAGTVPPLPARSPHSGPASEPRSDAAPSTTQVQGDLPWQPWLGLVLVLIASFLPWLHIGPNPDVPFSGGVTGNAWRASIAHIPAWLTVIAALVASLLATLRATGNRIPSGAVIATTLAASLYLCVSVISCVASDQLNAGIGMILSLLVFFVWSTAELRRHGEASLRRRSHRRTHSRERA